METLTVEDLMEFDPERRVRKRLILSERLESELVCYSAGQSTVEHHHVGQDEIFLVLEGHGTMTVDGVTTEVGPTSMVFAPADSKHSVQASEDGPMAMVFFKAPGRGKRRSK